MSRNQSEPAAAGLVLLEGEPFPGGSTTAGIWSVLPGFGAPPSPAARTLPPSPPAAPRLVVGEQTATAGSFLTVAGRTGDLEASVPVRSTAALGRRGVAEQAAVNLADLKYRDSVLVTHAQIDQLPAIVQSHHPDWAAVSLSTVQAAKAFTFSFWHTVTGAGLAWVAPHVASDAQGAVTFEWWHGSHTLAIYVEPGGAVSYLTSWGLHIWDEMDEGASPSRQELIEVWKWLQSGK